MKGLKGLIGMTFLAALVVAGISFAGPSSENPNKRGPAGAWAGKKDKAGDPAAHRLGWLSAKLDLTEEQKESLKPIFKEEAEQLKTLRQDETLTEEAKREKAREIRQATQVKINQVLTPEQQAKLAELRKEGKEKRERKHRE